MTRQKRHTVTTTTSNSHQDFRISDGYEVTLRDIYHIIPPKEFLTLYLAGKDVSKDGEGIVQRLIINALVQILYKHVADATLSEGRVPLRPHESHGTTLNQLVVHRIQGSLS